jgi:hypothetical protein
MNPTRNRSVLALLLAATVSLAGCAANRQPAAARISPDVVVPVGAGQLAASIVPHARPIDLHGEFSAAERAAFEQARAGRIANRPRAVAGDMHPVEIALCVVSVVGIVFCPLAVATGKAAYGAVNGIRYVKASVREPSLLIPERHADKLATMFQEQATGASLAARASGLIASRDDTDVQRRLVVRMKSAETWYVRPDWLGIRIIAEAQAFPVAGIALAPTEHVYAWTYGPLSGWTEAGDEVVRQRLDEALNTLAASIVTTYRLSPPW